MLKPLRRLDQAGDTLVEVLIAMAIIGMVLGGAYATASRSLRIGRQAQERTEALKFTEAQLEKLKFLAPNATARIFDTSVSPVTQFCLQDDISNPALAKRVIPDVNDTATYPPECQKAGLYYMSIVYDSNNSDLFKVSAVWDRIGSGGQDNVTILYRLHE